jgi:hypothetical protein
MGDYKALLDEREALINRIAEIDKEIKNQERVICRGKMQKAIDLLKECEAKLWDIPIFDIYQKCEQCGETINIELYLTDIIGELEKTMECCLQ